MAIRIKDVAEKAGVSTATVSRVLNNDPKIAEKTKKKVLKAIHETGYRMNNVARSLKTSRTRTIGFLAPELVNDFFMTIAQGVEDELKDSGYSLIVCNSNESSHEEEKRIELLAEMCVDGVIIIPSSSRGEHYNRLKNMNIPAVLVDRLVDDFESDAVLVDNLQGAYKAMEYLINKDNSEFGFIGGDLSLSNFRERYEGFCLALEYNNIPKNPDYIKLGDCHIESGYKMMEELMNQPHPPAHIFIANYFMHVGATKYLTSHGYASKAGNQTAPVHIASFDDMTLSPILGFSDLTVSQPMKVMGREAARLLLERISGENEIEENRIVRLETNLVTH
ncbi:MAG: LacI family DNA-binding transcriptional regulator [Spirochaetales bacterium]|nr:LacI family DNA-binding transcriptional regulator [Spirochaetales bacterium]